MENNYNYFKRDISWLSFNYRVLLEAEDEKLPLYERINFIAIYSSNLDEFYRVRFADHKAIASGAVSDEEETPEEAKKLIYDITAEVNRQLEDRINIYEHKILPELRRNNIIFYQGREEIEKNNNVDIKNIHQKFIKDFFQEDVFPFLYPVPVTNEINTFLRDNRLYLVVRTIRKDTPEDDPRYLQYFIIKIPYDKVKRFIELPGDGENYYVMYSEDIIKYNLEYVLPGYDIIDSYCIKISRMADLSVDHVSQKDIVETLKKKVKKRKIGAVSRFVYDWRMPLEFLEYLMDVFKINKNELVPGDRHLNMEDLRKFPRLNIKIDKNEKPKSMMLNYLDEKQSIFNYVTHKDLMLFYPYHSFKHFIDFLYEAVHDPETKEIMITQYRVAENSEVIDQLLAAARNGKKVTVFVELKARFDEENNLETSERMRNAGINLLYSLPGLKVHAKVALVLRENQEGKPLKSFAYISTGNFNEKTALIYADMGLFTSNETIVNDLHNLFLTLQGIPSGGFKFLLVPKYNLMTELNRLIDYEISLAQNGKEGRIILKMNALQDHLMINRLYEASLAGVQIDLIIRGVCCLVPHQFYSRNIRVTRIVDSFLEHTRIWYFGNNGNPLVYFGSPDWMRRNLYRRIEAVAPILDAGLKQDVIEMLDIQLKDNQKACFVEKKHKNKFKIEPLAQPIRAQYVFYEYLRQRNNPVNETIL